MRASAKRMFSLLLGGIFLIAALVVYGAFIKPQYRLINNFRGALAAKVGLLTKQEKVFSSVQNLLARYQGAARLREGVLFSLPVGEKTASIFNQINALAVANNLTLLAFEIRLLPSRPAVSGGLVRDLGVIQISFKLSGHYLHLKNFLGGLETNIRLMDIQDLRMENNNYSLVVNTYYQVE